MTGLKDLVNILCLWKTYIRNKKIPLFFPLLFWKFTWFQVGMKKRKDRRCLRMKRGLLMREWRLTKAHGLNVPILSHVERNAYLTEWKKTRISQTASRPPLPSFLPPELLGLQSCCLYLRWHRYFRQWEKGQLWLAECSTGFHQWADPHSSPGQWGGGIKPLFCRSFLWSSGLCFKQALVGELNRDT